MGEVRQRRREELCSGFVPDGGGRALPDFIDRRRWLADSKPARSFERDLAPLAIDDELQVAPHERRRPRIGRRAGLVVSSGKIAIPSGVRRRIGGRSEGVFVGG